MYYRRVRDINSKSMIRQKKVLDNIEYAIPIYKIKTEYLRQHWVRLSNKTNDIILKNVRVRLRRASMKYSTIINNRNLKRVSKIVPNIKEIRSNEKI